MHASETPYVALDRPASAPRCWRHAAVASCAVAVPSFLAIVLVVASSHLSLALLAAPAPPLYTRCTLGRCDAPPRVGDLRDDTAVVFVSAPSIATGANSSGPFLQRREVPFGNFFGLAQGDLSATVRPQDERQQILGFGAAFTDAAADTLARAPAPLQKQLLGELFGPQSIGYSLGRVPIAGTDFSPRAYTYDDGAADDVELRRFNASADDVHRIPLLQKALALEPELLLMASPWSAPGWMKSNGGLVWGSLKPEHSKVWAEYFCRFLEHWASRGVDFRWVAVQNEPSSNSRVSTLLSRLPIYWNSMSVTPEQVRDFIKDDLAPALGRCAKRTEILFHDDQRSALPTYAAAVLGDPEAARHVAGAGVHWYDASFLGSLLGWYWIDRQAEWSHVADFTQAWPNLTVLGTEAAEGFEPWSRGPKLGSWWRLETYAYDILRDLQSGAHGWIDWNLLLAMDGGPNWAGNRCDAALLLETNDKYPAIDGDAYIKQPMFYALAHFSAFVPRGSRRVAVESADFGADVPVVAFRTPTDTIVAVYLNRGADDACLHLRDARRRKALRFCAPPHGLVTAVWRA